MLKEDNFRYSKKYFEDVLADVLDRAYSNYHKAKKNRVQNYEEYEYWNKATDPIEWFIKEVKKEL